ncbi:MAG TPA: hypothetical protein VN962_28170 [Polyangia bacterium]|nr:hypothetical protein [Polyangia bacterium]
MKVDGTLGTFLRDQRSEVVNVMRPDGQLETFFKNLDSSAA